MSALLPSFGPHSSILQGVHGSRALSQLQALAVSISATHGLVQARAAMFREGGSPHLHKTSFDYLDSAQTFFSTLARLITVHVDDACLVAKYLKPHLLFLGLNHPCSESGNSLDLRMKSLREGFSVLRDLVLAAAADVQRLQRAECLPPNIHHLVLDITGYIMLSIHVRISETQAADKALLDIRFQSNIL